MGLDSVRPRSLTLVCFRHSQGFPSFIPASPPIMSTKDETVTHDVRAPGSGTRPSKKRRCGAHCKKFWWAYLIAFCCIVVLVVCLVIFVGVPNITQDKIDAAKLDIQGVNILETEPGSFLMEVNSTITTDGSIHADVDGFVGQMYLEDPEGHKPFASLEFPPTTAAKNQEVNVSQQVNIADMDAFRTFNIWFVNNETLKITIDGKTKVKPSGLDRKYDVDFKKTLEVKGLNLFRGTEVIEETARLELEDDDEGKNFYGEADIPNPSHFTLDIGNVSFTNFVDDQEVGTLYIDNLFLVPGNNRVNISAHMEQTRIIPFHLQGENVTNHGEDLGYFAAGLGSNNQTVEIDIKTIVQNNLNTTIQCGSSSGGGSDDEEEDN